MEKQGAQQQAGSQQRPAQPGAAQQGLRPQDDEERVGVEEDVQAVHVHAVHAEPGEEGAEPVEQQQPIAQALPPIRGTESAGDSQPQPQEPQGPGAAVHGAEAVDGVPGQIRPLPEAHLPERFGVFSQLPEGLRRIEDQVVCPDALGKVGHGDKGQLHRLPAQGVNQHGAVDGEGEGEVDEHAAQRLLPADPFAPQQQHTGQQQKQGNGEKGKPVAVHAEGEEDHGAVEDGGLLRALPQEREADHKAVGEEIAVQRPAALHEVPGADGEKQQPQKRPPAGTDPPQQPVDCRHAAKAPEQHGQPRRDAVHAEEAEERRHAVAQQHAHLPVAPGGEVGREPGAEAVGAVLCQRQRVHRRHGAVLVEAAGHGAEAVEPQQGEEADQPPERKPPGAGEGRLLPAACGQGGKAPAPLGGVEQKIDGQPQKQQAADQIDRVHLSSPG